MNNYNILILNGPNLGSLGKRQPEIYGHRGLQELPRIIEDFLAERYAQVSLSFYQSNIEGELIDRLEQARTDGEHAVVLNAGAYTHTSLALADCLAWVGIPCVEVHLSNIWAREEKIRHQSLLAKQCLGVIAGFGLQSYALGVLVLLDYLQSLDLHNRS